MRCRKVYNIYYIIYIYINSLKITIYFTTTTTSMTTTNPFLMRTCQFFVCVHNLLSIQFGWFRNVRYHIVGRNEVENFVQNHQQNVLDGFADDRSQRLRYGSPVLVQICICAVLCKMFVCTKRNTYILINCLCAME